MNFLLTDKMYDIINLIILAMDNILFLVMLPMNYILFIVGFITPIIFLYKNIDNVVITKSMKAIAAFLILYFYGFTGLLLIVSDKITVKEIKMIAFIIFGLILMPILTVMLYSHTIRKTFINNKIYYVISNMNPYHSVVLYYIGVSIIIHFLGINFISIYIILFLIAIFPFSMKTSYDLRMSTNERLSILSLMLITIYLLSSGMYSSTTFVSGYIMGILLAITRIIFLKSIPKSRVADVKRKIGIANKQSGTHPQVLFMVITAILTMIITLLLIHYAHNYFLQIIAYILAAMDILMFLSKTVYIQIISLDDKS